MNPNLGSIVTAKMIDENDEFYFVQIDGETYKLPKQELDQELHIGGMIKGFVYENEDHQLQMTTKIPAVRREHFSYGTVVAVRRDLGVFVDIGLPNKDVVVSIDELPTVKPLWPQQGDKLMIALKFDNHDRMWGQLADEEMYTAIANRADDHLKNVDMTATVYRLKMVGTLVLTDEFYLGFIHPSEREVEPRLGQHVKVRVIGVRPDGTLNLSMKPRSFEAIPEDAQMLVAMMEHSGVNAIPYTDKTDPETIREVFGISKGQFKRAIGNLLKQRLVEQVDGELRLLDKQDGE